MEDIKCVRVVYKSSTNIVQGGIASKKEEGKFVPILDVVTPEFWFHAPSNLMIVDNFDLEQGKCSRIFFTQGSQGAPWLTGYPEQFTGQHLTELTFGELMSSDYLPRRLKQLKEAYGKLHYAVKEKPITRKKKKIKRKSK